VLPILGPFCCVEVLLTLDIDGICFGSVLGCEWETLFMISA